METVARLRGLTKAFAHGPVLKGVDLDVRPGEVMGLVGRNGVGKSTLAAVIAGHLEADAGELHTRGSVALIEQRIELADSLTVTDALYRNRPAPVDDHEHRARIASALSLLVNIGIPIEPRERIGDLTRSELTMVEAARILVERADLTIIDEVSGELNPRELHDLLYILERLTAEGRSVLHVTHNFDEALQVCDRIAVMVDGRITEVMDTAAATPDAVSQAVFGQVVQTPTHVTHAREDVLLSVRGLDCGAQPVNLDVRRGEAVALLGERADGPGAVVGALTGDAPRPVASLTVDGTPAQIRSPQDAVRLRIGYLPLGEEGADVTQEEALARGVLIEGLVEDVDFDDELAAVMQMMEAMRSAEEWAARRTGRPLSGGQRQWARIQDVLTQSAQILILENPTRHLDAAVRQDLVHQLQQAREGGAAVIIVTRDPEDALLLSDRILVMEEGALSLVLRSEDTDVAELERTLAGRG